MRDRITSSQFYGQVRCYRAGALDPDRWVVTVPWRRNTILYEWATIVGRRLLPGTSSAALNVMYLEYENLVDPDDDAQPPSVGREEGIGYYDGLAGDTTKDYLRVATLASLLRSSDEELFPDGNQMVLFAQTAGVVGVHGKPFGEAYNSKVFGAALVAAGNLNDAAQDKVFSRFYLESGEQQLKLASSQVGMEWEVTLG